MRSHRWNPINSESLPLIVLLVMSIFPLWVAFRQWQFLTDDAYITLTYSKSIAAGRGFVFNYPPATLGTTTPLFTWVVATLAMILPWVEISQIAVGFTALCWMGTIWVIYLGRKYFDLAAWQAVVIGIIIIADAGYFGQDNSTWVILLGMESHLFIFLLILSMLFYLRKKLLVTGILVGLLFLTRGEGILLLFVFVLYQFVSTWIKEKKWTRQSTYSWLQLIGGTLFVILCWSIYAQLTFDRILPDTLSAKIVQGYSGFWTPFLPTLLNTWLPHWWHQFALPCCPKLSIWWLFIIVGLGYVSFKKRHWLILLAWIMLYIGGYALLNVSTYGWYQLPILFVLRIFAAFGLIGIIETIVRMSTKHPYIGYGISTVGLLFLVVALILPRIDSALNYTGDRRASSYITLAKWFRENTEPSRSVAYAEIGYLGYYTENRIIDLMGLILPDIIPHIADGDFSWGFWYYQPDYYVYLPEFDWALGEIYTDPRFEKSYKPVATLPGPGTNNFVIYVHVD
ncbi:MAG: hypothetical protein JXR84_21980 [Anaerolineae bacterium]|nr:hypothetical protein [Anaerolineae bacterium]